MFGMTQSRESWVELLPAASDEALAKHILARYRPNEWIERWSGSGSIRP